MSMPDLPARTGNDADYLSRPVTANGRPAAREIDHMTAPRPEPMRYPEQHVLAIVDTPEAVAEAVRLLTTGGFLASEVTVLCGAATADHLRESPGHSRLLGAVMRLADRLNLLDDELEEKRRYEEALRAGGIVVLVLAPTEERKQRAADVLRSQGGHFINFMGRFTSERLTP
jgi:hypothetical protein